ncbi:MAG: cytochrome P450 [Planctomycetaceae bacterium]
MPRFPPGPRGQPLIGSFTELQRDILGFIDRSVREYGDVVGFRIFGKPFCILGHPELIEQVLVRDSDKFIKSLDYRKLAGVVGQGLLTSEGETWRRQRKLAQPIFHNDRVKDYLPIFVRRAQQMAENWRARGEIDVHGEMMRLTLEIVCEALFRAQIEADVPAIDRALDAITRAFMGFPFPLWIPLPRHLRARRQLKRLDAIIYRMIGERKAELARGDAPGNDLLSLLLTARDDSGRPMSDRQLRDELITVFLAGHETTAIVLTFAIDLIARHPDVESRLRAEWEQLPATGELTAVDLAPLDYTRAVLQETMRLYPPAWFIGRETINDYEIGGYQVSRGTTFFLCPFQLHRDERFFPDPLRFDPGRWQVGAAHKPPRYAYFPFGAGLRSCIGAGFAMLEMAAALPMLLRGNKFTLTDMSPIELLPAVTLRPGRAIRARVEPL